MTQQHPESSSRPESVNLQQQPQINANVTVHSQPSQFPHPQSSEHSSSSQQHNQQTPPIQTSAYQPLWAYGAPPSNTQSSHYQVIF